jgi:Zn-dependent protease with chaperone function
MSMRSDAATEIFVGRFSDGKTAGARDAEVRFGASGIEIVLPGGDRHTWSFGSLATAEPLGAHAIDALLNSSDEPGAALFVPDTAFARALTAHAPHLAASAIRWKHARPWLAAALGVALAALLITWLDLSPARTIAERLPERARAALGAAALASMTEGRRECHSRDGDAALDRLKQRLSRAAGGAEFDIVIVDWGLLNAFAVPGRSIVVTSALLEKAESPDEVAGVLAHEMGHGLEMHPETALVRVIGLSAAADLMLGGSSGTLANVGLVLAQLSYSRAAEREADMRALELLKGAGIPAKGFAGFFGRVVGIEGGDNSLDSIAILRTHPPTEERRRLVESQPDYPATPSLSEGEWAALKAICNAPEGTRTELGPNRPPHHTHATLRDAGTAEGPE